MRELDGERGKGHQQGGVEAHSDACDPPCPGPGDGDGSRAEERREHPPGKVAKGEEEVDEQVVERRDAIVERQDVGDPGVGDSEFGYLVDAEGLASDADEPHRHGRDQDEGEKQEGKAIP